MRTTVNLEDSLLDEAQRLTGIAERTMLIHEGLRALIERESARRMRLLVDTSIWVDHLRTGNSTLTAHLEKGLVVVHPLVIGELACGNLRNRRELLGLLGQLPSSVVATHDEALHFIEHHRLPGRGIGYMDVHLLAAAALSSDVRLWTLDRRLATVAGELKLAVAR